MKERISGFDLARAYAIFGMLIVNFSFCFGTFETVSWTGKFQHLFIGNATSVFIILAGMGLSFMASSAQNTPEEKKALRKKVLKRSWFLFALGLIFYNWWPGDILHFYGGYMHVAAFLLFVRKSVYLWFALGAIVIYQLCLFVIPVGTGWDFATSKYLDFWTVEGFFRSTFYNGWNSLFPWISFFFLGMWLGHMDWKNKKKKRWLFISAIIVLLITKAVKMGASYGLYSPEVNEYMLTEYNPIVLPFLLITASCGVIAICVCHSIGNWLPTNKIILSLASLGKMTLSMYIFHITVGMLLLSFLTGIRYTGYYPVGKTISSEKIMLYVVVFYAICLAFSKIYSRFFKRGPLESLMRFISK